MEISPRYDAGGGGDGEKVLLFKLRGENKKI